MSENKPVRYYASKLNVEALDVGASTADTAQLAELVQTAFLLSLDGRLSTGTRGNLNALGVQLRNQLRELLAQVFEAGTTELVEANKAIDEINADLKVALRDINKVADLIENLGALVASLDKLLGIVGIVL